MLFSSGSEFALIVSFLLLTFLVKQVKGTLPLRAWIFAGNAVLLMLVINWGTLLFHILLSLGVYSLGKYLGTKDRAAGRTALATAILMLIGLFCFRNYEVYHLLGWSDVELSPALIIKRLGISYILFRHIQFLVDSRNGKIRNYHPLDYVNFVLFFPNFLAGPIDVYNNFKRWVDRPNERFKKSLVLPGVGRIFIGLVKKYAIVPFLIADATNYQSLVNDFGPWLGILLSLCYYSLYIYLDFSGYSDIAIGTGYVIGIRTPENFRSPYLSVNLAEFWRRWHITFSDFLRNMIFKPFVTRLSSHSIRLPRLAVSIIGYLVTFTLCGIWHGTSLNFIYWGLWHGVGLAIYKIWNTSSLKSALGRSVTGHAASLASDLTAMIINILFVTIGWVFFHYKPHQLSKIMDLLF